MTETEVWKTCALPFVNKAEAHGANCWVASDKKRKRRAPFAELCGQNFWIKVSKANDNAGFLYKVPSTKPRGCPPLHRLPPPSPRSAHAPAW